MKNAEPITPLDLTEKYKAHIAPLMRALCKECSIYGIPMYACVAVKNDENGTVYEQEGVSAITNGLTLKDDWFVKMVNVSLGFDTVLREDTTVVHNAEEDVDRHRTGWETDSERFMDVAGVVAEEDDDE